MKVLIVEDNRHLAASLRGVLKPYYVVDVAGSGSEALNLVAANNYAVVMLDLGLPDIPGQMVCRMLRERGVTIPILIATGIKDPEYCISLLDTGADDYITKPYHTRVLLARVRALLRRGPHIIAPVAIIIGDLIINTATRKVEREGVPIPLRKKEFDMLEYLARHQGQPLSRDMIFSHVWEADKENWNNTVDVHIKYLRDKIDKPFQKALIKTAYGVGYMVDDSESEEND